jgi:hypothetical protein
MVPALQNLAHQFNTEIGLTEPISAKWNKSRYFSSYEKSQLSLVDRMGVYGPDSGKAVL